MGLRLSVAQCLPKTNVFYNTFLYLGGVVLAFHHGPLPVDYMYLVAYTYLKTGINNIPIYRNKCE